MLKQFICFPLFCMAFTCTSGFSAWSVTPQESVRTPDEMFYETGMNYLKNSQYDNARLSFQSLLKSYPDSHFAASAHFAIGDAYFEEGGTENLLKAWWYYTEFQLFFPGDPKVPLARMKVTEINEARSKEKEAFTEAWRKEVEALRKEVEDFYRKEGKTVPRNRSQEAEQECFRFLSQYPYSEYAPIIMEQLRTFQRLQNREYIEDFYRKLEKTLPLNREDTQKGEREVLKYFQRFQNRDEQTDTPND